MTWTPNERGVGRRAGSRLAKAICMKSSASMAARPRITSTRISAMAKTSVHGPVAPCERLNCSGAPYCGVNEVISLPVCAAAALWAA
ncbi:MAG: hypothetical protein QM820_25440 [Minicystis sp.]